MTSINDHQLPATETAWVRDLAKSLGFDQCGVAPAENFPELDQYSEWLERGYAGEMKYLADSRRLDPRSPMPNARSIIVCALNYNSEHPYSTSAGTHPEEEDEPRGWISRYAWGDDYHEVLWEKLNKLTIEMRGHFPVPFESRAYADTGPIHERAAAKYAGLGWLGKNTLLINQSLGSWFFLGVILTSLPLTPTLGSVDAPPPDRCGTCRRCLDACPTQAIVEPYLLDATRCISYLTIELRGSIPEPLREPMGRHIFGCDICQDVCPWNRKAPRTQLTEFQPRSFAMREGEAQPGSFYLPELLKIANLSPVEYREAFRGSPIKRTKWRGLLRNACIALGNAAISPSSVLHEEIVKVLQKLSRSGDVIVSESANWALSRIQSPGQ